MGIGEEGKREVGFGGMARKWSGDGEKLHGRQVQSWWVAMAAMAI